VPVVKEVKLPEPLPLAKETGKKKKWEKLEVNFQYDPPQTRRGRGAKAYRNPNRAGPRDPASKGKEENKEDKPRVLKVEGEATATAGRESVDKRSQSLNFDPGHRPQNGQSQYYPLRGRTSQEPLRNSGDKYVRQSSHSRSSGRNLSGPRSGSPSSPHDKESSPSTTTHVENGDKTSPPVSPSNRPDQPSQLHTTDEQEQPAPQPSSNRRNYRGANTFTAYPQGQFVTPQMPMFPPFYPPPPIQTTFGRAHSVPYAANPPPRFPQAYPMYYPDVSRMGIPPQVLDEDLKIRINRQVYVSPVSLLMLVNITSPPTISTGTCSCANTWTRRAMSLSKLSSNSND
jgi:hypothetical protein